MHKDVFGNGLSPHLSLPITDLYLQGIVFSRLGQDIMHLSAAARLMRQDYGHYAQRPIRVTDRPDGGLRTPPPPQQGRPAGRQALIAISWPVDDQNRNLSCQTKSVMPVRKLNQIICTHNPDQLCPGAMAGQFCQAVGCEFQPVPLFEIKNFIQR